MSACLGGGTVGVEGGGRKRKQHRFDGFRVGLGLLYMTHVEWEPKTGMDELKKQLQGGALY